jgi:hypothetical protein
MRERRPRDDTKNKWDPRREFDVMAVGYGSVVWRDYGDPPRWVITRGDENPRDVAERREKEGRERGQTKIREGER